MNSDYILREINKIGHLLSGIKQKLMIDEHLSPDEIKSLFSQEDTLVQGVNLNELLEKDMNNFEKCINNLDLSELRALADILEILINRNLKIYDNLDKMLILTLKKFHESNVTFDLTLANKIKELEEKLS